MRKYILGIVLAATCGGAPILTLTPPATISGSPGSTIGWGFSINNDTAQCLVVSSVTPTGFNSPVGAFSNFIAAQNFYVVNPNTTLPEAFNNATQQGFGRFVIGPLASPGNSTAETFDALYDLYAADPNVDPSKVTPENGFARLSATVNVVASTGIPEPASLPLAGSGVLAMLLRRRISNTAG